MTSCATEVRCRAVAGPETGDLLATIEGLPDGRPERHRPVCELAAGHDGRHAALVGTSRGGDQWWWLRWRGDLDETAEVLQTGPCDAELPHGKYADDCLLPDGHPGPHSFHLPPLPSVPGELHPGRIRPHTT